MPNTMNKEQGPPSYLRFQVCNTLDVSSVVPAPSGSLIRGLYPKCVCFHPTKPLMAVGVSGYLAVYDMQSNTRLGRVDLKSLPVEMAFAPDGSVIIVVVQDWILYSVSTSSWKARQVVPRRAKMDKPLESCLLAVAPGHNPFIYFCRYAKDTLRLATLPSRGGGGAAADGAAGGGGGGPPASSGGSMSGSSWGTRVKLDAQKAVLALACHHLDMQLLVLTADGNLRGYAIAGPGGEVLTPLFAVQVQDMADKVVPPAGVLTCVSHPALPTGAIILQGSRLGSTTVLEAPGRTAPTIVLRGRVPGHFTSIGMGICRASNTLLVFGHNEYGRVRCTSWRMSYKPGSVGLTLRPSRVDPQDITPLLDVGRRTKAALNGAMAAGALAAENAFIPAAGGAAAAAAGAQQAGGAVASAAATTTSMCHSLWGNSPAWTQDAPSSYLLDSGLGPSVGRVLLHPALGVIAVVPDLPRACAANREVLFSGRAGLSGEELALARRTSTLVLMSVTNLEAPVAGWRGARLAPQHSPLSAWMPPSSQTQINTLPNSQTTAAAQQQQQQPAGDSSDDEAAAAAAAARRRDKAAQAAEAAAASGALALPPHVYYLAGTRLFKYGLATCSACTLAQLPPDGPDGDARVARQVLHSPRAGAWLLFFESGVTGGGGGGAAGGGGGGGGSERFSWSLLNATSFAADGGAGYVNWIRAGKSGCFLGPDDSHFCVMSSNGKLLEVFETAATSAATAGGSPLLSVSLEGGVLLPGLGAPVFPGPPMTNAPVPDARAPPESGPQDVRRFHGSGVVMWQSADWALNMTTLPALKRVPLEPPPPPPIRAAPAAYDGGEAGEAGEEGGGAAAPVDDSPPVYPTMPMGHHFGPQQRQAHLPMLPHETVIYVAWQSLELCGGGGAGGTAGGAAADAVAAVLTSQRLLLVTAGLRVVCAVSLATHGSVALQQEPLTSVMWAGPMLLVSTATGQVLQLTWTGSLLPVATLSPTGFMALMGVTSDALIVLRTPLALPPAAAAAAAAASGGATANAASALAEVVARPAALLQPLLIGWASLAATGLLSYGRGGAAAVRPALRQAFSSYDAVGFTPRGVWALIAAGAWDVAAAIASHMPPLDVAVRLAAAAAAGDWSEVSTALLAEASRALHAPAPPPRGSELHSKLVAAGAGALSHGQLATAEALFQAAGEWPAAMILSVCQGDSQALTAIAHKISQQAGGPAAPGVPPGAPPTPEAQLAGQLAVALRHLYGGVGTQVGDVTLTLARPGQAPGASEPLERADRWTLALPQGAPTAVAVLLGLPRAAVPDPELGPIPSFSDRSSVLSYYGLTATAAASVAAAGGGFGFGAGGGGGGGPRHPAPAADRGAGAASVTGSSSHKPGGSTALGDLDANSVDSNEAAQAAARAEFFNQFGAGGPGGGGGGGGGGFGRGITGDFSSDEDSGSEVTGSVADTLGSGGPPKRQIKVQIRDPGAAASAAAGASLREAVAGIRVPPPGGPAATAAAAAAPPPPVHFPPGMSSAQLYAGGVAMMEAGDWRASAAHFSRAMAVLQHEERAALDDRARAARLAFCAQYYAAVRLLEAVGSGAGPREARLYRYLAGLGLDDKHANALLREAVTRNRTVGNYRYAADQLTALIAKVMDTAPAEYLAQMQAEIEECDRHGGRNAGIPADEQVADWAMLVRSAGEAGSKEDVDGLVLPLLK